MAIQARWGTDHLVVPEDDPFAARVEQVGLPIHLHEDVAELNEKLVEYVTREAALYDSGVRCAIKDHPDTTCHACPISARDDPDSGLRPLCQLGHDQEVVLTELRISNEARGRAQDGNA